MLEKEKPKTLTMLTGNALAVLGRQVNHRVALYNSFAQEIDNNPNRERSWLLPQKLKK